MKLSLFFGAAVLVVQLTFAQRTSDLAFGQVYGSVGFLSSERSGGMTDAPGTVLAFTPARGSRELVLAGNAGDYIALLQPGHYCISAYTRAGKVLMLGKSQPKCVDVASGKDVRLDVMLMKNIRG